MRLALALILMTVTAVPAAAVAAAADEVAARACAAIAERVEAVRQPEPVFLRSYDGAAGNGPDADPALGGAFTYDNALAAIALSACGRGKLAERIGDALLQAVLYDRAGPEGRLRNAYRPGPQTERPVPPMGWWDDRRNRWLEDPVHVGTATGNVAWAGLALMTLAEQGAPRFLEGAERLGRWLAEHVSDPRGPGGFTGGIHGFVAAPQTLGWKSTEHNVDLAALFGRLEAAGIPGDWSGPAATARAFVAAMWQGDRFLAGTAPDGISPNRDTSGLDAQLWPLLLADAPAEWRRVLAYVETAHGVPGGFDFNADRDGLWVEGTAQAALVYRTLGRDAEAVPLFATLAASFSPGGYLWATREPGITTGLALSPQSTTDDFRYYRRPHLGATAWAALASLGRNPFRKADPG